MMFSHFIFLTAYCETRVAVRVCEKCRFFDSDVPEETVYSRQDFEVGSLIADRYQIVSVIGEGGMGLVYKAKHVLMNRFVALKMIRQELISNFTMTQRFHQEAQAVSQLQHQNIVAVYDFGITPEGIPYLVMDYLDGKSLAELIAKHGKIPLDLACEIFMQACRALEHAHNKGIIHRDFKSSNLMVCPQGNGLVVKVVDFGMAKLMRPGEDSTQMQELTQLGEVFGSPLYMSPEQCRGQKLDPRSDIYSLACVMYYAICGQPPCLGENVLDTLQRQIHDDPQPMRDFDGSIPAGLEEIIMKALRKNPDDRYQSVTDVMTDLQAVLAGRERVITTVQMKKPDLKKKKQLLFSHNFETNMIFVLALIAICVVTAYLTGRFVEVESDESDVNRWVDNNLAGDRFRTAGKFDEAQKAYLAAATEAMRFGKNDPRLAKSLVSLAGSYVDDKEYAKGELQLKRASAIYEQCYGKDCPELGHVMLLLARSYEAQGKTKEAKSTRQKAYALIEAPLRPRTKQTTSAKSRRQ